MFLYKYRDKDKGNFMGINNVSSNFNISAPKNNLTGLGGFAFAGTNNGAKPKTAVGNTNYLSAQTSGIMGDVSFVKAEGGRPDRTVGETFKAIA